MHAIGVPRMPPLEKISQKMIDGSDLMCLGWESKIHNKDKLNKRFNTDKWTLFPVPPTDVDFLIENFYRGRGEKEERIITYFPSSDLGTIDSTVKYLKWIHRRREIPGYMTAAWRGKVPSPFKPITLEEVDKYYDFVSRSLLSILGLGIGSVTVIAGATGTLSVGSNETTAQKLLFPELAFSNEDYEGITNAVIKILDDPELYKKLMEKSLERLRYWYSTFSCRRRFEQILKERNLWR